MSTTQTTQTNEEEVETSLAFEASNSTHGTDQILHLKRLLVTLKQQYEKSLQQIQEQLQKEQSQCQSLTKKLVTLETEQLTLHQLHQEELQALGRQIVVLRDKRSNEEENSSPQNQLMESRYVELLNQKITLEHSLEFQLSTIIPLHDKIKELEQKKDVSERLLLEKNHQYEEVLNEKLHLNHHVNQLQSTLEHHLGQTTALQTQVHHLEQQLTEKQKGWDELQIYVRQVQGTLHDHQAVRDENQALLVQLSQEKGELESQIQTQRNLLEESEMRFKVSQQHLAKKVKEAAILNDKVEQQQLNLAEYLKVIENYKAQNHQLQTGIEQYQSQENRLHDQLREALKNSESQISKWEEKYFRLYDKCQEGDVRIRDLQKIEEKHNQMLTIVANLAPFLTTTASATAVVSSQPHSGPVEQTDKTSHSSFFDSHDGTAFLEEQSDQPGGHFDLFGMQVNKSKH